MPNSGEVDPRDQRAILEHARRLAAGGRFKLTLHARQEMVTEQTGRIRLTEMLEAVAGGEVLENYPDFYKGPCCLIGGRTAAGRPLHVVCSTTLPTLVFITAYEPTPPAWTTPTERGEKP